MFEGGFENFSLMLIGGQAVCQACSDTGARTPSVCAKILQSKTFFKWIYFHKNELHLKTLHIIIPTFL